MKKVLLFFAIALSFSLQTYSQININNPTAYEICGDGNGSGIGTFDLTIKDQEILGSLTPNDFVITYHITQSDAENNINPLASPFASFSNPQTICARVEQLSTGSFEVTCFDLIVYPVPIPNMQDIYSICDGDSIVIDSGFYEPGFEYAWYYNGIILSGETNPSLVVSQTGVYGLQLTSFNTGCTSYTDFEVISSSFNDLINPSPYEVCDNDGDGFYDFDLDTKVDEILGGNQNPTLVVSFHETQADADADTNALISPYTNIVAYGQTLYVRVQSIQGDCFGVVTLDLIVDTNCVSASPVEAVVCVEDPNIPVDYDLTSQEINIVNGQNPTDFTFTYYYSETNALSETNPITNPTAYSVSGNSSVVYVRVEDNASGNFTIVEYYINASYGPDVYLENAYTICGDNAIVITPSINSSQGYSFLWSTGSTDPEIVVDIAGVYTVTVTDIASSCVVELSTEVFESPFPDLGDAMDMSSCEPNATFDLTVSLAEILNGLDASQFDINFFNNANNAYSNIEPIIDPTGYVPSSSPETIYVRVQNVGDDCFEIRTFNVIIDDSCPVVFECADGPINNNFCYDNNNQVQYVYENTDGLPIQVVFNAGQVEVNYDALVVLDSDGVTNLNPEATTYGNNGDVSGLMFISSGSSITITVVSDNIISCESSNYTSIDYDISCADPNALPSCTSALVTPEDGAIDVEETTELSWSNASGIVDGYKLSIGITSGGTEVLDNEDVGNVTSYDAGVLDYETTYYVTIIPYNANGDAESCTEQSFTTRANPNQIVVCEDGAINTTYCYDNNDTSEFSFQSSDGQPLTIVFNSGSTEVNWDELYIVDSDGSVMNPNLPYGNSGDFTGLTYTSTGDSITVRFDSDGSVSCVNGSTCCTAEFDFDVFCASSVGFIQVNAFVDANTNSIYDTDEFSFSNGYFTYEINGDGMINTVNSSTGHFQIISGNETDTYDITFNLYDESEACYDITTASFSNISVATGSTVTIDFPVVEEQSCEDLAVYLINNWAPPRPGFTHSNYLYLENLGFTTISSGTVEFVIDPQLVYNNTFSVNPTYTITNTATGFTVDFVNLQPGDVEHIGISITCPVSVTLGDIVTNTATYLTDTNDLVASNNYSTLSEVVVGSWDPNDKMESHGPDVVYDEFSVSDEWLYYTIRFQNLGTAAAEFVRIEDAIDDQLNKDTFQMLRASHDYVVTRTENDLEWYFEAINLAAEQDDEEGSKGFVYYRIKPMSGYAVGDIIPNTAAIYFDYNAPVITNRFETRFIEPLSVDDFETVDFSIYPNPANDKVTVALNNNAIDDFNITLLDIQGKEMRVPRVAYDGVVELNVSSLNAGMYFVQLRNGTNNTIVKKLIIE